jgi:hypothetical protein
LRDYLSQLPGGELLDMTRSKRLLIALGGIVAAVSAVRDRTVALPQAWAAGSVFMLTQALLGFLPDAPRNKLNVDPFLPAWLPDLTVRDLHIGKHKLDIRFWREGEETAFQVVKGDPALVERCDIASKVAEFRAGAM